MPLEGRGHVSMLSWLELTLLEERQALATSLTARHVALLREISPYLKGVEPNKFQTSETTGTMPPCSNPKSSEGDMKRKCRHFREEASKLTPPPRCLVNGRRNTSTLCKELDDMEIMTWEGGGETKNPACKNQEVLPVPLPSIVCQASHRKDAEPSQNGGQLCEPGVASWAWRRSNTSTSNKPLKEILSARSARNNGAAGNGPFARLDRFVKGAVFESGFALLILINTLVMALESQYTGIDNGWKVGYPDSKSSASNTWPGAIIFFEVAEWVFGLLFTIELLLKIVCFGKHFCFDAWNFIDTIIVIGWFLTAFTLFPMPIDPMLLRLARSARLLRLLKLIRKIRLFDSLYLMTTAMQGSFSVLLWSVVLLALVQTLLALFLQSFLEVYILDEKNPEAARLEVFMFYGTFARCILTMFEITLGNFMPPCRALVENVSEWWMLFSLTHKVVIGFSVLSVITSVFIQETFQVATIDDKIMIMSKERARMTHTRKISALFDHADSNGDGGIDIDEFQNILADSEVTTWLSAMELDVRDNLQLYELLDVDGDGKITVHELVDGVSRLKGTAKNYDVLQLQKDNKQLMKHLHLMQSHLQQIANRLFLSDQLAPLT